MYQLVRAGQAYLLVCNGEPVRSALGRPITTVYRLLAEDLCGEFNRRGPSPRMDASLGTLHSTYLDCLVFMPREELEHKLLARYDALLDVALNRPADVLGHALMTAWFGPVESKRAVAAWLANAPLRQLVSAHVGSGVVSSVLVAYRLLRVELPAATLAAGLHKYGHTGGRNVDELTDALERVKRYGMVPEEPG